MLMVLTWRRREVSDAIAGRITQCGDSHNSGIDSSDVDSEEEGGK